MKYPCRSNFVLLLKEGYGTLCVALLRSRNCSHQDPCPPPVGHKIRPSISSTVTYLLHRHKKKKKKKEEKHDKLDELDGGTIMSMLI